MQIRSCIQRGCKCRVNAIFEPLTVERPFCLKMPKIRRFQRRRIHLLNQNCVILLRRCELQAPLQLIEEGVSVIFYKRNVSSSFVLLALILSLFYLYTLSKNSNESITSRIIDINVQEMYEISESRYAHMRIKIDFPQIDGINDTNKQKEINELIKEEALKILDYYRNFEEETTVDINYVVKWKGGNLLSIQYFGLGYIEKAAYPLNIFYTTNVNINTVDKVKLTDVINLSETFVKKIIEGKYVAWDAGLDSAVELIKEDISRYNLLEMLEKADSMGEKDSKNIFCYFTKDSLVVSISVIHALGDHVEFEINYSDFREDIKDDNEIWKDFEYVIEY